MPTFLELAGVDAQAPKVKADQVPVTGSSFLPELMSDGNSIEASTSSSKVVAREIWGKQGLRAGSWKIVNQPPPMGNGDWQLYNLENDIAEQLIWRPKSLRNGRDAWSMAGVRTKVIMWCSQRANFAFETSEPHQQNNVLLFSSVQINAPHGRSTVLFYA